MFIIQEDGASGAEHLGNIPCVRLLLSLASDSDADTRREL